MSCVPPWLGGVQLPGTRRALASSGSSCQFIHRLDPYIVMCQECNLCKYARRSVLPLSRKMRQLEHRMEGHDDVDNPNYDRENHRKHFHPQS